MLSPVRVDAPLVNPAPNGLYAATQWSEESEPLRWLPSGVEIKPFNYGLEESFGVWGADWCASESDLTPADVKEPGVRPAPLDSFAPITVWAADSCDLLKASQTEVRTRAAQVMRLREQVAVEREFANRVLVDAGTPDSATDIVGAVAQIEELFGEANTVGAVHASIRWAARASDANLIVRSGASLKTPLGHTWVFGGGYAQGLGNKLVATSPTMGWRGPVAVRTAEDPEGGRFVAIAERSVLVGYEALIGAVDITP